VPDPFDFDNSDAAPQEAAPRDRRTSTGLVALGIVLVFVLVGGGVLFFAMRAGVFSGGSGVSSGGSGGVDEATSDERRIIEKLVKEETLGAAVSIEKIEKVPYIQNGLDTGAWMVRYVYRYRNPPAGVPEVVDRIVLLFRGVPKTVSVPNPVGDRWKANWDDQLARPFPGPGRPPGKGGEPLGGDNAAMLAPLDRAASRLVMTDNEIKRRRQQDRFMEAVQSLRGREYDLRLRAYPNNPEAR
jgi:hypothetical protein